MRNFCLFLVAAVAACGIMKYEGHPLRQWSPIGAHVLAWVINMTDSALVVSVRAPELENDRRQLGTVAAHDSTLYRLPFGDTKIQFFVRNVIHSTINAKNPGTWRIVIKDE